MSEAIFQLGQKALVLNENQEVLMVGSKPYDPEGVLLWDLPGGRVDEGEDDLRDALARELDEELQIKVEVHELISLSVGLTSRAFRPKILLAIYHCAITDGDPKPSNEVLDYKWMPFNDVADIEQSRYSRETMNSIASRLGIN